MIWSTFLALSYGDAEEILDQLGDFDFRYMLINKDDEGKFSRFTEWLFAWVSFGYPLMIYLFVLISMLQGPRNTLVRTEAQHELDKTLLDKVMLEVGRPMEPAVFPLMMIVSILLHLPASGNHPLRTLNLRTGISSSVTLAVCEHVYSGSMRHAT
jgi:hypothetical protein